MSHLILTAFYLRINKLALLNSGKVLLYSLRAVFIENRWVITFFFKKLFLKLARSNLCKSRNLFSAPTRWYKVNQGQYSKQLLQMVSGKLSPGKLRPKRFPPRKFSPGIILPMFLDILLFFIIITIITDIATIDIILLSFKKLKLNLLRCIKRYFAACLPFRKYFGYDENVLLILIKEMFNFTEIRRHQKELSIESEKTCEESFYMLKTTFLQHPCDHLFLCITFSTLSKILLTLT